MRRLGRLIARAKRDVIVTKAHPAGPRRVFVALEAFVHATRDAATAAVAVDLDTLATELVHEAAGSSIDSLHAAVERPVGQPLARGRPCPGRSRYPRAMRRTLAAMCGALLGAACSPAPSAARPPTRAQAPSPRYSAVRVAFRAVQPADSVRYPGRVEQSFTLERSGALDYSAYYGSVPINMNHNDSARWDAGAAGRAVFDAIGAIVADPAAFAELQRLPEGSSEPIAEGTYRATLSDGAADSSWALVRRDGRAFRALDAAFSAMVARFRQETGRPLAFRDLPQ